MSLLCRLSCFPGAVVQETVEISQLLLLRNRWLPVVLAALRGGVGLKGIFKALYEGTGLGVVSTGTRPIIRGILCGVMDKHFVVTSRSAPPPPPPPPHHTTSHHRRHGMSDSSAHFFAMSGWRSQWPLPSLSTTAHSARRRQGPEERHEMHYTATFRKRLSQGGRPPCLGEPREPQDKGQGTRFSSAPWSSLPTTWPWSRFWPVLCRRWLDQLVAVLARYDTPIREQVIEVPRVLCPPRFSRTVLRTPQEVEQLVEVPTVLSYALLQQQTAEQVIDIPVPHRRRGQRGLQGSHPGQRSTAKVVEQIVDIPVRGGLPGFFPRQRSSQRTVEQLVDIPVLGGGLHVHLPDPGGFSVFGSFAG